MRETDQDRPSSTIRGRRRTGIVLASVVALAAGVVLPAAAGSPAAARAPIAAPVPAAAPAAPAAAATSAQPTAPNEWMPEQLDAWTTITQRTSTPDLAVTNGVTAHSETIDSVSGRVPINVISADTTDPNVQLRTVVSNDSVIDPANETVSSMAERTGAVAGINGGYFQIHASGAANDGEIVDGEIFKSPTNNHQGTIAVLEDGSVVYGPQDFSGTIIAGGATHALASINTLDDAAADSITTITPRLGEVSSTWFGGERTVALGTSTDGGGTITITSIGPATELSGDHYGLVAGNAASAGGQWLLDTVKVGATVQTKHRISPDNDISQLIQGPGRILADGQKFNDPHHQMPSGLHPETAVGSTADGRLIMVTLDGQKTADVALGANWTHVAGYLKAQGVVDAILLDGGGSTEMVVRKPGDTTATVVNTPSDLGERPVANGLFVYSTAKASGPATTAFVNNGVKLSTAVGASTPVPAHATDKAGNPSSDTVQVTATPAELGSWSDGVFTARKAGSGRLTVRAGDAVARIPLTVSSAFDTLTVTPDAVGLANGAAQQFTVAGTNGTDPAATIAPAGVDWTLDTADFGTVDPATGLFTAAAKGSGAVTVTAAAGGAEASATISVGAVVQPLITADSGADWKLTAEGGAVVSPTGHPGETDDVPPGSTQAKSLTVDWQFPNDPNQHRVKLSPNNGAGVQTDRNEFGQVPENLFFTFRVDSDTPVQSWIVFNVHDAAGHLMGLWIELKASDYNHWVTMSKSIHRGVFTDYPLTISDISFVGQYATSASTGSFSLAGFEVDYPAGTPTDEQPYTAIDPNNPTWLQYEQDSADFRAGGQTFIIGDDGHLVAANPGSTSAVNVDAMAQRIAGTPFSTSEGQTVDPLPEVARPEVALSLGDISDTGNVDDLEYAKSKWETFGAPLYDVVGNHEISQGSWPQDGHFYDVFGQDTHFTFQRPGVSFIGLDNAWGSIAGSDKHQVPDEPQFPWFVEQLEAADTPVVFVGIHMPAYDPSPSKTSQFSDRWEARQFLQVVQNYRLALPDKRVVVMYGHSRGFANQLLDPLGNQGDVKTGIPQFTIADIGTPPYYAAAEGGFYHFALFHVNTDGTVQYTVEPMLKSVTLDQGTVDAASGERTDTLRARETKHYSATAVNANGDNISNPPTMPVADPMSHVWSSSDERVASIDPVTGEVLARRPGTTTISVQTGGITESLVLTVGKQLERPGR